MKKQYKTPQSREIVLSSDEILAIQGGGTSDFTEKPGSGWDDDEAKGLTWEDAMW